MDSVYRTNENAHRMIFVSDLPKSVTYLDLVNFYETKVGPCQVNIKRTLFKPFYYSFVLFEKIEDAKRAAEEYRFPRIKDDKMSRALPYNQHVVRGEAGGRDFQSTSIFVKGFEKVKWTHEDLYAKFCQFGKILSCKVSVDAEHNFLGFGYIQFSKIEEAQKAIEQMDKYDLSSDGYDNEGLLSVLEYQGKKAPTKKSFNNVYVKNFSKDPTFTDEQLVTLFQEFGDVQNASVMRDHEGNSKGFGFVCFSDPAAAEIACASFKKKAIETNEAEKEDNPVPFVCEAKSKEDREKELKMNSFKYKKSIMLFSLFVKNFPAGTTEEELTLFFRQASNGGEVTKVSMVPGTEQAFINFEKQDSCKIAKEYVRNALFKHSYALYAEYCYPKEMRAIRFEENLDKKAQERRRQERQTQLLNNQSGAQNLIELLTMLLKPGLQNQGAQKRSHSMNNMGQRGGFNQGGMNPHMMQRGGYQNNNRGRGYYNNNHGSYHQQRNNSVGVMPQPQMPNAQPLPPQLMNQQNHPGQSVASGGTSQASMDPQQTQYANMYNHEMHKLFSSSEYMSNPSEKKEQIGNTIFKHVTKIVGTEKAPKITGMLIDLPEAELNYSVSQWTNFLPKVQAAFNLISENENNQQQVIQVSQNEVTVQ